MKKAAAVAPMEKIDAAASLREMMVAAAAVWCEEEESGCFAGMLSAEANSVQSEAVVSTTVTRRNLMIESMYVCV